MAHPGSNKIYWFWTTCPQFHEIATSRQSGTRNDNSIFIIRYSIFYTDNFCKITLHTNSINLSCLLHLHGSLIKRYSHSNPKWRIKFGALSTSPLKKSNEPPTPMHTIPLKWVWFASIHSSCAGDPKATKIKEGFAAATMEKIAFVSFWDWGF